MISKANDLDPQTLKLEVTWQTLNIIDAAETIYIMQNPSAIELNPFLGKRPSTVQIVLFKTGAGFLHYYAAQKIYDYNPKAAKIFEYVSIAAQGSAVGLNLRYVF